MSWIWRYLPGAPLEVPTSTGLDARDRIALLTTNVFQNCRDAGALLQIIDDADPDLVLAVETDEWWSSRLTEALRTRYPHVLTYPLSNGYGMSMFSRLELLQPIVRFLVDDAIPSIKTGVRLRSEPVIDLYGLHPQPPAPLQDSTERDIELVLVGVEIKNTGRPSVVLADLMFNNNNTYLFGVGARGMYSYMLKLVPYAVVIVSICRFHEHDIHRPRRRPAPFHRRLQSALRTCSFSTGRYCDFRGRLTLRRSRTPTGYRFRRRCHSGDFST